RDCVLQLFRAERRCDVPGGATQSKEDIMKKGVFAIALTAVFLGSSQTNGSDAKKSQLDGTWELVSGQQLTKGARDIKIISEGHFIFVAYDTENGKTL